MARMKAEVLEEFLQRPLIAVIAVPRTDGRPYQAPVWFLWHDRAFWLTGTSARTWCKLIVAHPRVSLCIEASDPVARYVAVDCDGQPIEPSMVDIWPVSRLLAEKYVGARGGDAEAFLANMRREPRLLFKLDPTNWRAIDLTVYSGTPEDRGLARRRRGAAPEGWR